MSETRRPSVSSSQYPNGEFDAASEIQAGSVSSLKSVDRASADIDLKTGPRLAGFTGKGTDINLMRHVLMRSHDHGDTTLHKYLNSLRLSNFNYHVDDADLLSVDEDFLNPFEWPGPTIARRLAVTYFSVIHPCIPIIDSRAFWARFESLPLTGPGTFEDRCDLATINLVFAIGAQFNYATNVEIYRVKFDHLTYYARARALGLDHRVPYDHPNLAQVRAMGLLTVYLLINNLTSW